MCVEIHQTVAQKCKQYLAALSRHNYVTPKSYLELLSIFSTLIGRKKQELHGARQRMKTGLDKVIAQLGFIVCALKLSFYIVCFCYSAA